MKRFNRYLKCLIGSILSHIPYFKKIKKYGLTVFVYHEVSDKPSNFSLQYNLAVSNSTFAFQMDFIKKYFNVVHPNQIDIGKELPVSAALVTFDDGMLSSFQNGLRILKEKQIHSLFFLNMESIEKGNPIISAEINYYNIQSDELQKFCKEKKLSEPYYLTITPSLRESFLKTITESVSLEDIIYYQGPFASLENLRQWADSDLVVFSNHLYQHWNSQALTNEEFTEQFEKNKKSLRRFNNSYNYFSFPNGQPVTCFTDRHINILKNNSVRKAFFSSGGINLNHENFLLDRISLTDDDNCESIIWYRIYQKELRKCLNLK